VPRRSSLTQEPDKAVDYTSRTLNELDKVQSKAILLNDMLNNAREGERIGLDGDVYDQVAQACRGARPKIQKWIEQDTGEREGMMGECQPERALTQTGYSSATISSTMRWSDTRRAGPETGARRSDWWKGACLPTIADQCKSQSESRRPHLFRRFCRRRADVGRRRARAPVRHSVW
jgi:hypothetical protein